MKIDANWMHMFIEVITAILLIVVPFVTKILLGYIKRAVATYENDIGTMNVSLAMDEIASSIETAVAYINQTYVDAIKKSDQPFTKEAQKEAFRKAYELALELMSSGAREYLAQTFDGVEDFLTAKIEAEVRRQKKDTVIDIPEVHVSEAVMVEKGPEPEPPSEDLVNG